MSPSPETMSICSAMVEITGWAVAGSNSVELASVMPARLRAASITMHCRPRQRPSSGMRFSRAYWMAPTLPETPRSPKPPGMQMPSTSPSCSAAPAGVRQSSEVTHLILTRALLAKPPARSASVTDR